MWLTGGMNEKLSAEELEELRFRESLQARRMEKGWSQGELARRMVTEGWKEFHQATISRIEKGQRPVRLGEARTLARLLDTDVGSMIAPSEESQLLERYWRTLEDIETYRRTSIQQLAQWEQSRAALRGILKKMETVDVTTILDEPRQEYFRESKQHAAIRVQEPLERVVELAEEYAFVGSPNELSADTDA